MHEHVHKLASWRKEPSFIAKALSDYTTNLPVNLMSFSVALTHVHFYPLWNGIKPQTCIVIFIFCKILVSPICDQANIVGRTEDETGGVLWPSYRRWSTRLLSARTSGIGMLNRWTLYGTERTVISTGSCIHWLSLVLGFKGGVTRSLPVKVFALHLNPAADLFIIRVIKIPVRPSESFWRWSDLISSFR